MWKYVADWALSIIDLVMCHMGNVPWLHSSRPSDSWRLKFLSFSVWGIALMSNFHGQLLVWGAPLVIKEIAMARFEDTWIPQQFCWSIPVTKTEGTTSWTEGKVEGNICSAMVFSVIEIVESQSPVRILITDWTVLLLARLRLAIEELGLSWKKNPYD